jgi:hypothetical protein
VAPAGDGSAWPGAVTVARPVWVGGSSATVRWVAPIMSEQHAQQQSPQVGIAEALTDLTQQTRTLVREEIASAQRETWEKALASAPAAGLLAGAGGLGLLSLASGYRASLRLLETRLPPLAAALTATAVYGVGAAVAGVVGMQRLRTLPVPFPSATVQDTQARVGETAAELRGGDGAHAAP